MGPDVPSVERWSFNPSGLTETVQTGVRWTVPTLQCTFKETESGLHEGSSVTLCDLELVEKVICVMVTLQEREKKIKFIAKEYIY